MQLVLHIGNHKTGSTAIQSALFENKTKLQKLGVLYPSTGLNKRAHHNFAFSIRGESKGFENSCKKTFDEYLNELTREIDKNILSTVIISSEEFFAFSEKDINLLKKINLLFDSVTILAYLRNHIDFIESNYRFNILWEASREKIGFGDFIKKNISTNYHEYDQRLDIWKSFSNNCELITKNFSDCTKKGFLNDFFNTLDLRKNKIRVNESLSNKSMSRFSSLLIRIANRNNWNSKDRGNLIEILTDMDESELSGEKERLYTEETLLEVKSRFLESNRRLCEKYGVDFSRELERMDKDNCIGETITEHDINRIIKKVIEIN